ncbi:hypothetical protein ACXYL9_01120 [Qipengyuania sp. CAU 1752]
MNAISSGASREGRSLGLKHRVRDALAPYPRLFLPIYRTLAPESHARLAVSHDTQIVIEGFPRSANTFAVVAFSQAQGGRQVRIAHHLHAEAQILAGVKRKLPVIVLIRRPEDAIRSLKIAFPDQDENRMLRLYLRFYRAIERVREQVVIAEFTRTTKDFSAILRQVNEQFGTDFAQFEDNETSVQEVFDRISAINAGGHRNSNLIARPAAHKDEAKDKIALDLDPARLAQAQDLFARLIDENGPSRS